MRFLQSAGESTKTCVSLALYLSLRGSRLSPEVTGGRVDSEQILRHASSRETERQKQGSALFKLPVSPAVCLPIDTFAYPSVEIDPHLSIYLSTWVYAFIFVVLSTLAIESRSEGRLGKKHLRLLWSSYFAYVHLLSLNITRLQ